MTDSLAGVVASNALAIGFGPTERASEAIFSIAVFPRWVSLFFLQGAGLPDPDGILQGEWKCRPAYPPGFGGHPQ